MPAILREHFRSVNRGNISTKGTTSASCLSITNTPPVLFTDSLKISDCHYGACHSVGKYAIHKTKLDTPELTIAESVINADNICTEKNFDYGKEKSGKTSRTYKYIRKFFNPYIFFCSEICSDSRLHPLTHSPYRNKCKLHNSLSGSHKS